MRYDLWLRGGTVVDGTDRPPFPADVLVKDGKLGDPGFFCALSPMKYERIIGGTGGLPAVL